MGAQVRILEGFSAVLVPRTLLDTEVEHGQAPEDPHGN